MAHTPGPWTVTCDADDDNERPLEIVVANDWNRRIAFPASDGNPDDARLIAAAPDLLELVRQFERAVEYEIRRSEKDNDAEGATLKRFTLDLIRAVIVKATGEAG